MTVTDALILGLLQGLTEFLPVSSSGHLVLGSHLLSLDTPGLGFEVWLHVATLVAVVVALRHDVLRLLRALIPGGDAAETTEGRRWIVAIVVGTLPAVVFGLLGKDMIENAFGSVRAVGFGLLATGVILIVTRWLQRHANQVTWSRALLVGVAQALAIFPGVSRSGSTLAAGLGVGWSGHDAARFSFLLSIPAILGALVLEADSLMEISHTSPGALIVGFVAAAVSGFVAIQIVWRVMEQRRLFLFAPYVILIGILVLILF